MLKNRITWLALGLIAALGVTVAAAPPQNLIPVYLWLSGQAVSASNPVPTASTGATISAICSNADVDTLEPICTISMAGYDKCSLTFTVANASLSDFNVDLANDGESFVTIATSPADYTTSPQGHIYGTSGDLTAAGTSGTHFVEVDGLASWDYLRFQAAGNSSSVIGKYRCMKE